MTTEPTTTPAIDALVDAMLDSCGQLAAVFDHMERHRNPAPDVPSPAEVLADLLRGIFAQLPAKHGDAAVATAAEVLAAASDLVAEELFLVNPDAPF